MWLISMFTMVSVGAAETVFRKDVVNQGNDLDLVADYKQLIQLIKNNVFPNKPHPYAPPIFGFYTDSPAPNFEYEFENAAKILKNPHFDNDKRTVIYIHGFTEAIFCESVKHIVDAYQKINDHNIVILDWHYYSQPPYFLNAVPNVFKIGGRAASAIQDMIENGLSLERLHIIGYSLGAQMAGVIGRTIKEKTNGGINLKRISGLDPAFPGFYGPFMATHISKYDAEYVDIIHTDLGVYGAPISTGTVDFWPNGGFHPQPGCDSQLCSHHRSWQYWAESLIASSDKQFNAITSPLGWFGFLIGITGKFDPKVVMGINCPLRLSGNYYLHTSSRSPFARGKAGVNRN